MLTITVVALASAAAVPLGLAIATAYWRRRGRPLAATRHSRRVDTDPQA